MNDETEDINNAEWADAEDITGALWDASDVAAVIRDGDITWPGSSTAEVSGMVIYSETPRRWVGRPGRWLAGRFDRVGATGLGERLYEWATAPPVYVSGGGNGPDRDDGFTIQWGSSGIVTMNVEEPDSE